MLRGVADTPKTNTQNKPVKIDGKQAADNAVLPLALEPSIHLRYNMTSPAEAAGPRWKTGVKGIA